MGDFQANDEVGELNTPWCLGIGPEFISDGLSRCVGIPGALQEVKNTTLPEIFIDYAHKPDALESVLNDRRELCKARVILVFGCGGERDEYKRPLMGQIAHKLADIAIITRR